MTERTLRVGVASYEQMKARTMTIARGEQKPDRDDLNHVVHISRKFRQGSLGAEHALLDLIAQRKPGSLAELETLSGRAKSDLSRTLKTMARYGLVELEGGDHGRIVPRAPYDHIKRAS